MLKYFKNKVKGCIFALTKTKIMTKIEIRKETKENGDIYFKAYNEKGQLIENCFKLPHELEELVIAQLEEKLKNRATPKIEVVKTIEI